VTARFTFQSAEEVALAERFLSEGCLIAPSEDREALDAIRSRVAALAAAWLGVPEPADPNRFLNDIGEIVDPARLNEFRLAIIAGMNETPWLRAAYFNVARATLETVVGSELCMQRRVNLSIQLPDDDSSLLPVHADTWAGDSPFEVVLWIPLVDCFGTKSMYLLPPGPNATLERNFDRWAGHSAEAMYASIEKDLRWMEVPYGHFLLFNQNLAHGNRVNRERDTRWTMNCRFKGVFTPYADKKLGEFFEPITLKAASRVGLAYRLPGAFEE
jgi:sporadic carbohydrate cluster 2OG-Fe(II) oxygenase